jgi:hypothetical protein
MILLPLLLLLQLIGTVPYRLYRKRFARPSIVNIMIGMTGVGLFGILNLIRRALGIKSKFELMMIAPPIILTVFMLSAGAAVYAYLGPLPAFPIGCVVVLTWIAWISYKRGFQTQIGEKLQTMSLDDQTARFESLFYRLPPQVVVGTIIAIGVSGFWGGIFFVCATAVTAFAAYWVSIVAFVYGGIHALEVLGPLAYENDALALAE